MNRAVLFVQRLTHRAGAQTCLARLLRDPALSPLQPRVICSSTGWLTAECERNGVNTIVVPFPSSRSLAGRWFGNAAFARRAKKQLAKPFPAIVHANDFTEGLIGLELARSLCACSVVFLRSATMRRADYFKYRCNKYDLVLAVGDELTARVQCWEPERKVETIYDGIEASEILAPKLHSPIFPSRVLVIGTPRAAKGWADLTEALFQLQKTTALPPIELDFTGSRPASSDNDLKLDRLTAIRCRFLGRVEQFSDLIRNYDLVINPSRMESFGMAAIEVIAAGAALLSSRTGVIKQVIDQPEFLFSAGQPNELALALQNLIQNWPRLAFDSGNCQRRIRGKFLIDSTITQLRAAYEKLLYRDKYNPGM